MDTTDATVAALEGHRDPGGAGRVARAGSILDGFAPAAIRRHAGLDGGMPTCDFIHAVG